MTSTNQKKIAGLNDEAGYSNFPRNLLNQKEVNVQFDSKILLSDQVFSPSYSGVYEDYSVGFLERLGADFPPTATDRSNIVLVEDRDKFNFLTRGPRFHEQGLAETFAEADAVLLVLFARQAQRERLGRRAHDADHEAAVAATLRGARVSVFIKTTGDRLAFWAKAARLFGPQHCTVRYTDVTGASQITPLARSAA